MAYRVNIQRTYYQQRLELMRRHDLAELEETQNIPRQRVKDRMNPLEALPPNKFKEIYGFSKDGFNHVLQLVKDDVNVSSHDNPDHITPIHQLSIFLDFLRTSSFQRVVGTQHHKQIHQSLACRVINKVAKALAVQIPKFVSWPDASDVIHIERSFREKTGFPFVIGLIDGTHIELTKPVNQNTPTERFVNRKGYFSLNCMAVCDHQLRFRHFTSRHCGSCHDARIFKESFLYAHLAGQFDASHPLVLLGDEGYGCEEFLLTPIREDRITSEGEQRYNRAHKKTRIYIEHAFGVLKKRFPCLLYALWSKQLENVRAIIAAAIILHNLVIDLREDDPQLPPNIQEPTFQRQLARGQVNGDPWKTTATKIFNLSQSDSGIFL